MLLEVFSANADILGDMDLDFENFDFGIFLDSKFLDFQVPRFPQSGPGCLGPGGPWAWYTGGQPSLRKCFYTRLWMVRDGKLDGQVTRVQL